MMPLVVFWIPWQFLLPWGVVICDWHTSVHTHLPHSILRPYGLDKLPVFKGKFSIILEVLSYVSILTTSTYFITFSTDILGKFLVIEISSHLLLDPVVSTHVY